MTKYRIFILGLKAGADSEAFREYLSDKLGIKEHLNQDRIIYDPPNLVYEATGSEHAGKIRLELESFGAAVEIKSPTPYHTPPPAREKENSPSSGRSFPKPLIYLAIIAVTAAAGFVLLNLYPPATEQSSISESIEPQLGPALQPPESAALERIPATEPLSDELTEPAQGQKRPTTVPKEAAEAMDEGRYEKAWSILKKHMESNPNDEKVAEAFKFAGSKIAKKYFDDKEYTQAAHYLRDVEPYLPDDAELHASLGAIYYSEKDYSRSRRYLDDALRLGIDDPNVHYMMARMYYYQDDDMDMARRHLRKALQLNPDRKDLRKFLHKITAEESVEEDFIAADSEHFIVKYQGAKDVDAAYTVLYILEEAWSDIGYDLGDYPSEPVVVILYTGKQFKQVTKSPHWVGGLYDGRIRLPVAGLPDKTDDDLRRLLYHEYTHVIVHRIAEGQCPIWFNEGLAQLMQIRAGASPDPWLKTSVVEQGRVSSLKSLSGPFLKLSSERALKAYTTSYFATKFFVREYGLTAASNVLEKIGEGKSFEEALREVTGTKLEDFEIRFHRWLTEYRD